MADKAATLFLWIIGVQFGVLLIGAMTAMLMCAGKDAYFAFLDWKTDIKSRLHKSDNELVIPVYDRG